MDRKIERGTRKPIFVAVGVGVAIMLVILIMATRNSATSYTLDGQSIRTSNVETGVYEDYIPLRGTVEPERTVFLDAVEGGRVVPLATSGASILSSTVRAAGAVIVPREREGMPEGEEVEVRLYDEDLPA